MTDVISHKLLNPSTALVKTKLKLFTGNRALQDALRFNWAGCDLAAIVERARLH